MSADLGDPDAKLADEIVTRLEKALERSLVGAACAIGACAIASSLTKEWNTESPQGIRKIVDTAVHITAELMGAISRLGQEGNADAPSSD